MIFYLVINSGSSSIKFKFFKKQKNKFILICSGLVERIGIDGKCLFEYKNIKTIINKKFKDHEIAINFIFQLLIDKKIIQNLKEIKAVGHRFVHGGTKYLDSVLSNKNIIEDLKKLTLLAPLHIPSSLKVLEIIINISKKIKNILVFDTSFHKEIPMINKILPIPWKWYEEYQIQKYGFHGISYDFILNELKKIYLESKKNINAIICHLGNGSSVSAIRKNKSINNTFDFSAISGLMTGTRSGNIDPTIFQYINLKTNLNLKQITEILSKKSGLLAISGISSDVREIEKNIKNNKRARLALDLFSQKVVNEIIKFANELEGELEYLVFTGGIGQNSNFVVSNILSRIYLLKFKLKKNWIIKKQENKKNYFCLTTNQSKIKILIIKTNEEIMICKEIQKLID